MTSNILVTEKEYRKAAEIFCKMSNIHAVRGGEAELAEAVLAIKARAVIVGVDRYMGPLYDALKETGAGQGSIIARFGVGHDGVDKQLASRNGIIVANTPGSLDQSVAEHALWLMGALARDIPLWDARLRQGEFTAGGGFELEGRCLGILGFGRIGRRVAKMAAGLGMTVWAAGKTNVRDLERSEGHRLDDFCREFGLEHYTNAPEELLGECDCLTIHLPATPSTRHFINRDRLALMKPSAVLVNTARGSLVDESALYDALASRQIAGAALDVFEIEPYRPVEPEKDLRRLPNVVLTPHIGSNTREANRRMADTCLANIQHFFNGELDRVSRVEVQAFADGSRADASRT